MLLIRFHQITDEQYWHLIKWKLQCWHILCNTGKFVLQCISHFAKIVHTCAFLVKFTWEHEIKLEARYGRAP